MLTIRREKKWIYRLTKMTAVLAWVLANGLDILSTFLFLQLGGQLAFAEMTARHHPIEFTLIYAGMRTLGTLAVCLVVILVEKYWPPKAQLFWSALTAGALITAIAAWIRIYQ